MEEHITCTRNVCVCVCSSVRSCIDFCCGTRQPTINCGFLSSSSSSFFPLFDSWRLYTIYTLNCSTIPPPSYTNFFSCLFSSSTTLQLFPLPNFLSRPLPTALAGVQHTACNAHLTSSLGSLLLEPRHFDPLRKGTSACLVLLLPPSLYRLHVEQQQQQEQKKKKKKPAALRDNITQGYMYIENQRDVTYSCVIYV